MKKCMGMALLSGVAMVTLVMVCVGKRRKKKCGVRHVAEKLMGNVNDFLDEMGL